MKLKDKTYDVLKWVTMICIPALGGAYAALAPVWGWPLADEICRRNGYESAVLEEDGSLTIVMSRSVYDEMIRQYKESVDKGIAEITAGDSSIVKIEYNEDYSEFTVTVSEDELGIIERQAADELVMYGTLYHVYTGNDVDHITVNYVNGSGETVETADSGSLDSAY